MLSRSIHIPLEPVDTCQSPQLSVPALVSLHSTCGVVMKVLNLGGNPRYAERISRKMPVDRVIGFAEVSKACFKSDACHICELAQIKTEKCIIVAYAFQKDSALL